LKRRPGQEQSSEAKPELPAFERWKFSWTSLLILFTSYDLVYIEHRGGFDGPSIITGGGKWVVITIPMDPLYLSVLVSAEKKFWR
jgi:hypothetical protein